MNNQSILWKCLLNPFKSCDCVLLYQLILFSKETKQTLCCEKLCCSCHLFSTMTVLIKLLLQLTKGMTALWCIVVKHWDRQASLALIFGYLPGAPLYSFFGSLPGAPLFSCFGSLPGATHSIIYLLGTFEIKLSDCTVKLEHWGLL